MVVEGNKRDENEGNGEVVNVAIEGGAARGVDIGRGAHLSARLKPRSVESVAVHQHHAAPVGEKDDVLGFQISVSPLGPEEFADKSEKGTDEVVDAIL